jgi:membrane associated rhomboid family serine protease
MHLGFNMYSFWIFGDMVEKEFMWTFGDKGKWLYLLMYLSSLFFCLLPTYIKNRENYNYRSLGASGAVSAVLFAFILIKPWATIYVYFLPVPAIVFAVLYIVYSIYMDQRSSDNVNHSAHLWGAAYGVAFTAVMEPRLLSLFLGSLMHPEFRLQH